MGQRLDFGLLGPLLVRCDHSPVSISPGFQRSLLAGLLLNANRVVPANALIDTLWDTGPPASARASLLNHVCRLRASLGEAGRDRLRTEPGGYLLALLPGELDVSRFEMQLTEAQNAARNSEWRRSSDQAKMALAQWRGQPLSDVTSLALSQREIPRLAEMQLQTLELKLDADLHLRGHAEAIPELRRLVEAHPLRENLRVLLMLALYRSDRQAEALTAYREARDLLVHELGTEPGAGLRDLHQRILTGDPSLTADGCPIVELAESLPPDEDRIPSPAKPRASPAPIRQLPPGTPYFAGRSAELATLTTVLDQRPGTCGGVVTVAIDGAAGVGKTTLAVRWAHQMADRFPDGQLYVNLRGYGPVGTPLDPAEAIRQLLEDLGMAPERIPANAGERVELYRRQFAGRRVVTILDNARDPDQVRPLLPGSPGCLAVVTSRRQLTGLSVADGAYLLSLEPFSEEDARALLAQRLGAGRICAEAEAVSEVIRLCGRLPLSLSIVAARAAARPAQPLAAQAAKLRNAQTRLDGLSTGDVTTDPRAVFSWSYQQVSDTAARLFRLIGVHPGPDVTFGAAASLAGIATDRARQALTELAQAHLVAEPVPGRHACHDLLRDYAGEQALAHETPETRSAAIRRLLDFYIYAAFSASRLLQPHRDPITIDEIRPPGEPEVLMDRQQALEWFRAERPVLLAAIETAAREGLDRHAWQLSWTMATFLGWQGHWPELVRSQQTALAAARRLGDRAAQATALHYIGQTQFRQGLAEAAELHQREALDLGRQLDIGIIQGRAHLELVRIADYQGRRRDAVTHAELALSHFQAVKSPAWMADALNAAAWTLAQLGDHIRALAYCEKALDAQRELGNQIGEAATLDSLGYIHHQLGHHDQAIACYEEALRVQGDTLITDERVIVLVHLGDAFQAAGEAVRAASAWRQALSILEDMGDPAADSVRRKLQEPWPTNGG